MGLDLNAQFYGDLKEGQRDYWRYMAAPRERVSTALSVLSARPPDRLADLGCGGGSLLLDVARSFPHARLVGFDRSSPQVERNRKDIPSVEWGVLDLDSAEIMGLEWKESFDVVTSLEVIEHVANPERLLAHAYFLTRPGGRLILSTQSGPVRETERRVGHRRHFSRGETETMLKAAGWRPIHVWNSGWPFHDLSKWVANLSPDRSMRRFGEEGYSWPQKVVCVCLRGLFRFNSRSRGAQLFALAEKPSN